MSNTQPPPEWLTNLAETIRQAQREAASSAGTQDPMADLYQVGDTPVTPRTALGVLVLFPTYLVLRGALRLYVRRVLLPKLPLEALYDIHARAELELPEGGPREYAQRILQAEVSRRARAGARGMALFQLPTLADYPGHPDGAPWLAISRHLYLNALHGAQRLADILDLDQGRG